MAGVFEAGGIQNILGYRIGHDRRSIAAHYLGNCGFDGRDHGRTVGRVGVACAGGIWLWQMHDGQRNRRTRSHFGKPVDALNREVASQQFRALGKCCRIAKVGERRKVQRFASRPCLDCDIGADAGRITAGDGERRQRYFLHSGERHSM